MAGDFITNFRNCCYSPSSGGGDADTLYARLDGSESCVVWCVEQVHFKASTNNVKNEQITKGEKMTKVDKVAKVING